MGILDKFRKKDTLTEEEKEKFTQLLSNNQEESSENQKQFDIFTYVKSLNSIHEINKIRNLLDEQEKQLTQDTNSYVDDYSQDVYEDIKEEGVDTPTNNIEIEEVDSYKNIEENSSQNSQRDNSINQDSYNKNPEDNSHNSEEVSSIDQDSYKENSEDNSKEVNSIDQDSYNDNSEDNSLNPENIHIEEVDSYKDIEEENIYEKEPPQQQDDEFTKETTKLYQKIKEIFGEENVFTTTVENSQIEVIKNKKTFHIGIRDKNSFDKQNTTQDENQWFIKGIKQLENLKEFKIIRSEEGIKDLLLERGDYAILLSFKATNILSSKDSFDFGI